MLSVQSVLPVFSPYMQASRWLVAYSGGVDSCVLLNLLVELSSQLGKQQNLVIPPIVAIHIDHQIHADSESWAELCQVQAARLGVAITVHQVDMGSYHKGGVEDRARRARYDVFESITRPDDVLFMAHHLDDQVETLLIRMLRGSGSRGMGAMPQHRQLGQGQLVRPLLGTSRSEIEYYAKVKNLQWVEDPSNSSSDYDRNFLRLQILPQLAQRWPEYRHTLSRAAQLSRESSLLNEELARIDINWLQSVSLTQKQSDDEFSVASQPLLPNKANPICPETLPIEALSQLTPERQKNIIRYWLEQRNFSLPSAKQLQEILESVVASSVDADPVVQWSQADNIYVQVRRFSGRLYTIKKLPLLDSSKSYLWNPADGLHIEGLGTFSLKAVDSGCLLQSLFDGSNTVTVRFRQGGERCQPVGRAHSQTLKKLFQEYRVETWLRDRIPLLYINDHLAAAVGYWVCGKSVV